MPVAGSSRQSASITPFFDIGNALRMAFTAVLWAFSRPGRSQPQGRGMSPCRCSMREMGGKQKEPRRYAQRGVTLFSHDSIDIIDYIDYTV